MNDGLFFQGSSESLNLQKKAKKQLAQPVSGILNNPAVTSGLMVNQANMNQNQVSSHMSSKEQIPEDKKKLKTTLKGY